MATEAFEEIADTFEFLDDWEDRYRHVIDMGKAMAPLDDAFKVDATKVDGCASQVWIRPRIEGEGPGATVRFRGRQRRDHRARADRGVARALFAGLPMWARSAKVDAAAELGRLGLDEHLSAQRSNGVRAMVGRIQGACGGEGRGLIHRVSVALQHPALK
jgi:cysteine desulfuration protein SufE